MVISLLSLLYLLTFGKGILMSSVAPFKGIRIPESGKSRNAESRIHRPRVTQNLRLSYISLHWGEFNHLADHVVCPVLVLELKSCMLCPSCDLEISPVRQDCFCFQCCYYIIFKGYIIGRVIIKGFLIHEEVKTNADNSNYMQT